MLCLLHPSAYLSVKVEGGGVGRCGWYGHDAKAKPSEAELVGLCTRDRRASGGWEGSQGRRTRAAFSPLNPVASVMSRQLGSHLTWGVKRP